MRKINYGLIVSDFDGTLVNRDGTISEKNQQAISDYVASGGKFVISTGRMPRGIVARAKELGMEGLVSCCQGSVIVELDTGTRLVDGRIPYETTLAIVEKMEEMGLHIHVDDGFDFYSNMDDDALKRYENALRYKAILVLDRPLSQFVREKKLSSYKVLTMVKHEENASVLQRLTECNFPGCTVTRSGRSLVEVLTAQYSKGTAVEFLAKHFNVPIERTVAVGDQLNDVPMIETAGVGVAVQNADIGLKEKANVVSPLTNEEGAIAWVIEEFGFQKNVKD